MAVVDSLEIQIEGSAQKATVALDVLVKRLDRVSASLSGVNTHGLATMGAGVNKLANAMSNFSVNTKTADFSRLARNLNSISAIDTSKFSEIASKMSQLSTAFNGFSAMPESAQQIGEFAKNISKLGNKSVQNAIINIPQLATAMRNLMQTLSTAPRVSANVINMTSALAQLATQGSRVGTASNSLTKSLNKYSSSADKSKKNTKSLSESFRNFYTTARMAVNVIKRFGSELMSSIGGTTEYIEAFNYYTVAFGKIASEFDENWEEYGSDCYFYVCNDII